MNNQNPLEFLFNHVGKHISPDGDAASFLMKPVPYVTKNNPEDGIQRLGSVSNVYFMASPNNSAVIAQLIGVPDNKTFKVIQKALPTRNAVIGKWLWEVEAPFLLATQGKASVEDNLRISQSLRGGIYCTSSSIEAFDLVMCREVATQLIEAGATKKYVEMQTQTRKLTETPYDESGMAGLIDDINKKRRKLVEAHPIFGEIHLPWPDTMESQVLRWLIDSKEVANV